MNKKEAALNRAIIITEHSFQFEKILKLKLMKAGFKNDEIGYAISKLKEAGLINDFKFAHSYGESLIGNKQCGPSKVIAALVQKGLDFSVATQITANLIENAGGEAAVLKSFIDKSQIDLSDIKSQSDKEKLVRKLSAKGFTSKTIFASLNISSEE